MQTERINCRGRRSRGTSVRRGRLTAIIAFTTLALFPAVGMATSAQTIKRHGFTLGAAYRTALDYERGFDTHVRFCRWIDQHDAACPVTAQITTPSSIASVHVGWVDTVTKNGMCPKHRLKGRLVSSGRHCFVGPLVVFETNREGWFQAR